MEVSATQRTNLDKLEEVILLQAEMLDLNANPGRAAEGVVVEAKIEQGRGPVATVLVQRGTLKISDVFVAGAQWGRVRALVDDHRAKVKTAGPAQPVELTGLNAPPAAGDDFVVVENEGRFHVRGSRSDEVGYYVEGASVRNPVTGASAVTLISEAVQEIQLQAGGFNAEYGGANGGLVLQELRTGGHEWKIAFHHIDAQSSPKVQCYL